MENYRNPWTDKEVQAPLCIHVKEEKVFQCVNAVFVGNFNSAVATLIFMIVM